jgi:hypothetical protein
MKKRFGICAITFVIAGLMISSVASIPAELPTEEISEYCREIDVSPQYVEIDISKEIMLEKSTKMMAPLDSYIIYDTEYDDLHPTLAGDTSGRFFAAFELTIDGVDYYPDFWYSLDDGMTWDEAGYFSESLGAEYPDVDSNENGFYGTFGGPIDTPGQQWVIIAEDLNAITGRVWDWSAHGFDDFVHMAISSYTMEGELWNYGGLSGTGYNGYQTYDVEGCPFIFYAVSDTSGVIGWLTNSADYLHSDFAIDETTGMAFSVYDNEVDPTSLLIRKDNFGVWSGERHPFVGATAVSDGQNLTNPAIEAHDNDIVIVAEEAGNIVCFYSGNGGSSYSKSTVVTAAMYPDVKVTFDGTIFACSYVKGGAVYRKTSEDGGATWTDEQQIEDSQTDGGFSSHDLGKGKKGIYSVWEDKRGVDKDIYFGQAVEITAPELDIISVKGPIGVTATIKNIGDAEATNVDWEVHVTGGILKQIDKKGSGNEATLGVGAEIKGKSGIIIGLGKIEVVATATCDEGSEDTENANGMQIFIFSLI